MLKPHHGENGMFHGPNSMLHVVNKEKFSNAVKAPASNSNNNGGGIKYTSKFQSLPYIGSQVRKITRKINWEVEAN